MRGSGIMIMANDPFSGIQSRYKAYCLIHGATSSEEMMAFDRKRYPGGIMCGYILWIGQMWRKFEQAFGQGTSIQCRAILEKAQGPNGRLLESCRSLCRAYRQGHQI